MVLNSADAIARSEHDETTNAKRVVGVDPFGGIITEGNFEMRFDGDYIGQAQIGTLENEAGWQIFKVNSTGMSYSDDTDAFNKKWSLRDSYDYSI